MATLPDATPQSASDYGGYSYQYSAGAYDNQSHQQSDPIHGNNHAPSSNNSNPIVNWSDKVSKWRFCFAISLLLSAILLAIVVSFTRTDEYYMLGLKHFHQYIVFLMSVIWPLTFIYIVIYVLAILKLFNFNTPTLPAVIVNIFYLLLTLAMPIFVFVYFIVACNTTRIYPVEKFSYLMVWGVLAFEALCFCVFCLIKANASTVFRFVKYRQLTSDHDTNADSVSSSAS